MSRPRLHELPDDILVTIVSSCDIDTLFSLRLSCSSICATIDAYSTAIAPAVARSTFPNCETLLKRPAKGYSLQWLRGLIPAQLASIMLDRDKLRRHPYIYSGYPYGIPSESDCVEARHWRQQVTLGWQVLRSFFLISRSVYENRNCRSRRPSAMKKVSGGLRSSRLWQALACPYPGCTEHGMKRLFDSRQDHCLDANYSDGNEGLIEMIRRQESSILKARLALVERLADQDLLGYVYLWRLLLWTFRPYREPDVASQANMEKFNATDEKQTKWSSIIHDITQGCSWLNWFILHVGPSPFIKQWSISGNQMSNVNHLRDVIWKAYAERSPHQMEIEREFACKLEFHLRKRCLSSDRIKRLEAEIHRGRSIRTISLECIPWQYDQHPIIMRSPRDFPWYKPGQWVWMSKDLYLQVKPGATWTLPGMLKASLVKYRFESSDTENLDSVTLEEMNTMTDKGPWEDVPYLIYLGTQHADIVWAATDGNGAGFAF